MIIVITVFLKLSMTSLNIRFLTKRKKCSPLNVALRIRSVSLFVKHISALYCLQKKEFACTDVEGPENITVVYSDGKKETFCKGCIKHYLRIMYNYFVFVDFNLKCS